MRSSRQLSFLNGPNKLVFVCMEVLLLVQWDRYTPLFAYSVLYFSLVVSLCFWCFFVLFCAFLCFWCMQNLFVKEIKSLKLSYYSHLQSKFIRTILSQCIFFTNRYYTHKNTHKQKLTNTKKKLTLNNKGNNFLRVQTFKKMRVTYFAIVYSLYRG